jgi:hypothetical protein
LLGAWITLFTEENRGEKGKEKIFYTLINLYHTWTSLASNILISRVLTKNINKRQRPAEHKLALLSVNRSSSETECQTEWKRPRDLLSATSVADS